MFGNPDDNSGLGAQNTTNMMGGPMNSPMGSSGLDTPVAPASPSTTVAPTPSDTNNNFVMTEPTDQPAPSPVATPEPQVDSTPANAVSNNNSNDLMSIKRQALQQLSPLVNHLDQAPEEEFRTTMMMIQASDDQSLLQKAYDAAQKITDEKLRAQALLDIVNEINYFTQPKNGQSTPPQPSDE
jgi:hypothetical protein